MVGEAEGRRKPRKRRRGRLANAERRTPNIEWKKGVDEGGKAEAP
jgi:hypothetical protein